MSIDISYVSDLNIEIVKVDNKRYLKTEPVIEEISKEDIRLAYKDILRNKPQQVGMGDFHIRHCYDCGEDFILYKRQTFCPICKRIIDIVEEDANFDYDTLFQVWQGDKNFLENILQGNKEACLYVLEDKKEVIDEDRGWGESDIIAKAGEPIIEELLDE